jgi:cysteine-rich repeat protein
MVNQGATTTLAWTVTGADSIKIVANPGGELAAATDPVMGMVTSAALAENTTFTLTASNEEGDVTKSVAVTVTKPPTDPTIDSFTATPMNVAPGGAVVLAWQTTNATGVGIEPGALTGDADGTVTVNPTQTTTYILTANGTGTPDTAMVTVTVTPVGPVISAFTANPTSVIDGGTTTLSWTVTNATNITINDQNNVEVYNGTDLGGSQVVTPSVAQVPGVATYRLTAVDADNNMATMTLTVSVNPVGAPVINSFVATPATVTLGMPCDLSWDVTGAVTIDIEEGGAVINTSANATGTYQVTPLATTTYTLVATDANNMSAMATVTVTVNAGPPFVVDFQATPNPVALNGQITLSFDVLDAATVRILNGATEIYNTTNGTGTYVHTATTTTNVFTLEATNPRGTTTDGPITIYAHAAPVINTFTVTPLTFNTGTPVTAMITWDVSNVASLNLLANGAAVAGFPAVNVSPMIQNSNGTYSTQVAVTTAFQLVATSAGGNANQTVTVTEVLAKMEPNNTATAAVPLPGNGTGAAGTINPVGDEDWYVVTVGANGWLRAETSDGAGGCTFDSHIEVYSSTNTIAANRIAFNDDIDFPANACSRVTPFANPDVAADADLQEMAAGTYYIRVRVTPAGALNTPPYTGDTGSYVLTVETGAAACGNGLFETSLNEQCDDGNITTGDGCDGACMFEINPTPILPPGGTVTVTVQPNGFQLVELTINIDGQSVTATAADVGGTTCNNVDTALGLATDQFTLLGGAADQGPTGTYMCGAIRYPADAYAVNLAVGTYYLAVFNEGAAAGQVQVDATIIDPRCGDGVLNPGEQCDDGNILPGDGCEANCMVLLNTLPAANPYVFAGAIPAGGSDTYGFTVTAPLYIVAETFAPDQATGCPFPNDTVITLRDGAGTNLGEDDEGGIGSCSRFDQDQAFARVTAGTYTITVTDYLDDDAIPAYELVVSSILADICGNGVVETGEECDDGNGAAGDGCDAACQIEGNIPVEVEPNNTFATANALGPNGVGLTSMTGVITAADLDTFSFVVPVGQTLDLVTHTYSTPGNPASVCGDTIDTEIVVYNPLMAQIGINDDIAGAANRCSQVSLTGLTEGTYFVLVRYWNNNGTPATGVGNGTGTTLPYFLDIDVQ